MMNRSKEMTHMIRLFLFRDNPGSLDRGEVRGWEGLKCQPSYLKQDLRMVS
jgi:hypothetical protein